MFFQRWNLPSLKYFAKETFRNSLFSQSSYEPPLRIRPDAWSSQTNVCQARVFFAQILPSRQCYNRQAQDLCRYNHSSLKCCAKKNACIKQKWISSLLLLTFLGKKSEETKVDKLICSKKKTLVAVDLTAPITINRRA